MTKQKTQEFKSYTTPKRVWKIFVGVLVRPKETMENTIFQWKEAWVYLLSFLVLSIANDQVQSWVFIGPSELERNALFDYIYFLLYLVVLELGLASDLSHLWGAEKIFSP